MTRLTDHEFDVLGGLECAKRIVPRWGGWLTPMFLGGSDGSHHSGTLKKLIRRGLVDRKRRAGYTRPSYLYRITKAGLTAWQSEKTRRRPKRKLS